MNYHMTRKKNRLELNRYPPFIYILMILSMKLSWLTWLRWFAALTVVFYHLNQYRNTLGLSEFSWDFYQFTEHLVFVVSIFFVFSGFFRSLSYWKTWHTAIEVPRFFPSLRERWLRIAPVYYLVLILTFILVIFWEGFSWSWLLRLFSGFTFLSWVSPRTFFPVDINWPLWFIAYDMLWWIGVSIALMFVIKLKKIWHIVWSFVGIWILLFGLHFLWISLPWPKISWIAGEWFPIYNPFLFGLHFLMGAVLWGIMEWMKRKKFEKHFIFDIWAILSFFFLGYFLWQIRASWDWEYSWPHGPYHFPITMLGIAWLIVSLPYSRYIGNLFDNALLSFIARISYSLYVFHVLIIVMLQEYVFTDTLFSWSHWVYFSLSALILSLVVAYIMNRWIENREWVK